MADLFAVVDAAVAEVTKARQSLRRKKTKQVFSLDETDQLKAVAYAWFRTHRPLVATERPGNLLGGSAGSKTLAC